MLPIAGRVAEWLARSDGLYQLLTVTEPVDGSDRAARLPGMVVKAVVMAIDGDYALMVTPADQPLDWRCLAMKLGASRVRPASQSEVEQLFPDCDADAVPALGLPYGVPLYLSQALREAPQILFPVGRCGTMVKMSLAEFERLAQPCWLDITDKPGDGP